MEYLLFQKIICFIDTHTHTLSQQLHQIYENIDFIKLAALNRYVGNYNDLVMYILCP